MHYLIFRVFNSEMDYKSYEPIRYFIAFTNPLVDEFRPQGSTVTAKEDNLILIRRSLALTRSLHSHSQGRELYIWPFGAFWRFKLSKELAISNMASLKFTSLRHAASLKFTSLRHGIFNVYLSLLRYDMASLKFTSLRHGIFKVYIELKIEILGSVTSCQTSATLSLQFLLC